MKFDLAIIGSGIGGLTVAAIASKYYGKKVLLLEQHFKAGGFTHVFKRKQKYQWDVGIHYIGDLHEGSSLRSIFDALTDKQVNWIKMPKVFEVFHYPWGQFHVPDSVSEYKSKLIELFPNEKESLELYFDDIQKASHWFSRNVTLKGKPAFFNEFNSLFKCSNDIDISATTKDYMSARFKSKKLQSLLVSQWGDHGLPPAKSSFIMHCLIVNHYLAGGYYPEGGSQNIADSITKQLESAGSQVVLNQKVTRFELSEGRVSKLYARDPRKKDSEETCYEADIVVSNAGAWNNYLKLLPSQVAQEERSALSKLVEQAPVTTNVTLYVGLKSSPESLGVKGENYWIFGDEDHDYAFDQRGSWVVDKERPAEFGYLSFPSLKSGESDVAHTAEIISFTDYESFEKWEGQPWKKKDEDYKELKENIANKLLDLIERVHPGFKELVDFYELSTPLTNTHFSNHPRGAIYGIPTVPERFHSESGSFTKVETPVANFFQTGADVNSPGVAGALMGGILTAAHLFEDKSVMKIFKKFSNK